MTGHQIACGPRKAWNAAEALDKRSAHTILTICNEAQHLRTTGLVAKQTRVVDLCQYVAHLESRLDELGTCTLAEAQIQNFDASKDLMCGGQVRER